MKKQALFFLLTASPLLGTIAVAVEAPHAAVPATKPNIIFVVADDMGYRDTGYSGNPVVKTTGETSVAIMEIALDFIGKRAQSKKPFFAQICFGSPHAPHQAAEEFKRLYPDLTSGRYAVKDDPESCQLLNAAWIDGRHMLRLDPPTKQRKTENVTLYDILADPGQEKNLAARHPEDVQRMLRELAVWRESVKTSFAGKDYIR